MAIVVIGVILIFGYSSIKTLMDRINKVSEVDFQKKLESSITRLTSEYGSVENTVIFVGSDYKQACFLKNYWKGPAQYTPTEFTSYPLIMDYIDAKTQQPLKTVFLIKKDNQITPFKIGVIDLPSGQVLKCFDIRNSKLSVTIEGMGDHILISE